VQIYGSFRSRTRRVLWAALEANLEFEHFPYTPSDPALKRSEYLKINPLGRVPAIQVGSQSLAESLAINLHIAKSYGGADGELYPLADEAALWQWTLFAASDLDPWVALFGAHTSRLPESERMPAVAQLSRKALERSLSRLETVLSSKRFLVGGHFSIADLNVASVLQGLVLLNYAFEAYPHVDLWLRAALDRPRAQAAKDYP
jgi:glutathione S-transferase